MSWPTRGNGRGWPINGRGYFQHYQHGDPGDAYPNRPLFQYQPVNHQQTRPNNKFKKKSTSNRGAKPVQPAGRSETPASHCPKCERLFDLRLHIPLILPCDHTLCEHCVKNAGTNEVKCPDCKSLFKRSADSQESYEKNMYLMGKIYVTKPYASVNEMNQLKFRPSGSSISHISDAVLPIASKDVKIVGKSNSLDACNMCKTKTSSVQCYDCQEVYCHQCCQKLHSSAKGLRSHKISPLNMTYCSLHSGNVMDMYCEDCSSTCCPYCVLEAHQGHMGIKRMTILEEDNKEEFKALLQECQEMRSKLLTSIKRASTVMAKTQSNDPENTISKSFVDLHALLQKLEHGITEKYKTHAQTNTDKLLEIEQELKTNISALDDLISTGKQVLTNQNNHTQNVNHLMDRMKNAIRLPHYFHEEKSSVDNMKADFEAVTSHIKQTFENVAVDPPTVYKLITKNEESFDKFDEAASVSSLNNSNASSSDLDSITTAKSKREMTYKFVEDSCRPGRISRAISTISLAESVKSCDQTKLVFKPGDHLDVKVTYISSPDSIYVQLVKQKQQLRALQEKIELSVQSLAVGTLTEPPRLNSLYIVKCDDNNRKANVGWCRGKVVEVFEDEGYYQVQLIDFGTLKNVHLPEFRYMPPELSQVAPLAYECRIYGVYATCDSWKNDVLQFLRTILYDTPVLMTVFDSSNSSLLHVDFIAYCDGDDYSVRESLIFIGFATSFVQDNIPPQRISSKKNKMATFYKSSRTFDQSEKYDVVVTHVVNPHNFYVQMRSEQENCTQMSNLMGEFYKDKKSYVISAKCNMAVALKIKDRNKEISWCRGQIKKVMMGEGKVEAFLVDTGHTITVHWKQIQKLNESFLAMEPQAINVRLAHVAPKTTSGWEQEAIDFMKKFSESREVLQMSVYSGQQPLEVSLLTLHNSRALLYVNTMMVHNNLALSTGELSIEKEYSEKGDKENDLFTFELLKTIQGPSVEDDIDDEDRSNLYNCNAVNVLHVESPDCIYIHFKENAQFMDKMTQMSMQLQQYYSKEPLVQKDEWKVNDFAVAYNSEHKQYYRVLIENIAKQGKFKVFARDFAISFEVLEKDIGVLDDQFFYNPPFAFRCQLAGIKPMGNTWSLLATDYVSATLLKKKNIFFAKAGPVENMTSCPGVFWYRISTPTSALEAFATRSFNLNKQLVRNGLATYKSWNISHLKINKLPENNLVNKNFEIVNDTDIVNLDGRKGKWLPPTPISDENFVATASYVDDNADIYFHVHAKKYLLVKIETTLTEYFEKSLPPRKHVKYEAGDRCSVKYHVNNMWYRGRVIEVKNNGEFKVCMIDYGNIEEVNDMEIRPEICFENEPIIASTIQLENVYPKSGFFNTSETDMLHSLVVDKNIRIEITNFKTSPPSAIVFEDDVNINEYMVRFVPNCTSNITQVTKTEIADAEDDVIIEYNASDDFDLFSSTSSTVNKTFTYKKLPDRDNFKITIINIIGFNKIVFELTEQAHTENGVEKFEALCSDINSKAEFQPKLTNYSINTPCVALFEDDKWYRGNIMDVNSDEPETLTIHFVDYGNFEKVPTSSVREIQDDWLGHPVEQYIAELYKFDEIEPEHYARVFEFLSSFYNETKKAAIKCVNPLVLQLFDVDDDDSIAVNNAFRTLVEEGILPEL